uniref:Major facilitator superfamily (MFS) profile domain-containing protein n=1 Tax=Chelonoidis abingdonii TaxID=106734 RepID=A0A8C0G5I8_CHEAB
MAMRMGESSCPTKGKSKAEDGSGRVITIVFLALLVDLLGFTLILPLLPSILEYYSKNDDGFYLSLQHGVDWFAAVFGVPLERKYNTVLFGGLIGSVFSILQFFSSPLTGAASDCLGRRPIMLLTVVGLIASYALWAISRSFGIFLLSRVLGGISKGNVSLSTAIIADLHSPKARSKGMVSYKCWQGVTCLVRWLCFSSLQSPEERTHLRGRVSAACFFTLCHTCSLDVAMISKYTFSPFILTISEATPPPPPRSFRPTLTI